MSSAMTSEPTKAAAATTPSSRIFTRRELSRVGVAATMLAVLGTVVILGMTMAMGHYNSLAHALPKAVVDGLTIALLVGRAGRWRCLSLLGAVYGLLLVMQVGVFYLGPVMMLAALSAGAAGRIASPMHRGMAVVLAAIVFELLAGFGAPIKIYFATGGRSEPFLWAMWFAEWPLRIAGASSGVWLAGWLPRWIQATPMPDMLVHPPARRLGATVRRKGMGHAGACLAAAAIASTAPLLIDPAWTLAGLCGVYAIFGAWAGLRRPLFSVALGLLWGWTIYGLLSYAWHRDWLLVADLGRTLGLRFYPLGIASAALAMTVRPVDLIRTLRRLGVSPAVLLPLTEVVRGVRLMLAHVRHGMVVLRARGEFGGPITLIRHHRAILRQLTGPAMNLWLRKLDEA